jgi:hypothetical protein
MSDNQSIGDNLVRQISKGSFSEMEQSQQITDGLVKSLGKSFFEARAGLITDIINQVEKDRGIDQVRANDIKNSLFATPLGREAQHQSQKLTVVPKEKANTTKAVDTGVDLFAQFSNNNLPKQKN